MTSSPAVVSATSDGVCWLRLSLPEKLSLPSGQMLGQLHAKVVAAANDDDIFALAITGTGTSFYPDADFDTMQHLQKDGDADSLRRILHDFAKAVLVLQAFPGLTIAAINGAATGAGLGLALACDLRIASAGASFRANGPRYGQVPNCGSSFWLPRMLGYSRALEMIVSTRVVAAKEALDLGLLHELVSTDHLEKRAQALALEYGGSADSLCQTKRLLRAGLEGSLEASLARETEIQEELFETGSF